MFRLALGLLLFSGLLQAQCALEIGTVASLKGTWSDRKHKRELRVDDVVCGDSQVERVNNSQAAAGDFLKLSSRSNPTNTVTYDCALRLGCERALDLTVLVNEEKRKLKGSGMLESFFAWLESRDRKTTTMSRQTGLPAAPVLQTVVVEAGKALPAAEVFRAGTPEKNYWLDLCPLSFDDACGNLPVKPKQFFWRRGGNLPFETSAAGLYLLYRLQDNDPELRTLDRVLVIVTQPSHAALVPEARDKIAVAGLATAPTDKEQVAAFEAYVRSLAARLTGR